MQDRRSGVLMCYPLGHEYMRAHFSFKRLASMFSDRGLHSMCFDYSGSGDSYGATTSMSMATSLANVSTALEEFRDTSGVARISIMGLRFGALLAALWSAEQTKVESLIMWDPVVTGKAYIYALHALHRKMQTQLGFQIPGGRPPSSADIGTEELVGCSFSKAFIKEIENLSLLNATTYAADRIFLYVSHEDETYDALHRHFHDRGVLADYKYISDAGDWSDPSKMDQMLMPSKMTNFIADALLLPRVGVK